MTTMHAFGSHVFGMPVFASPQIPVWGAGRLGPLFSVRPPPPGFPVASAGCCPSGPPSAALGLGATIRLPSWDDVLGAVGLKDVARQATDQLTAKVRTEAEMGAKAALAPHLRNLYAVAGAGAVLGAAALALTLSRKRGG